MTRWVAVCAYDGTHFAGWQSQAGGKAIQDILEARLEHVLHVPTRVHGSGRTDAGVHARAQVFHFDADWKHGAEKFRAAIRSRLPHTLQIKTLRIARPDFHARFSAKGKRYAYFLILGEADPFVRPFVWSIEKPLDVAGMKAAVKILKGQHDFRAFTTLNGPPKENSVRNLRKLDFIQRGRKVRIVAEADGFMYKMMRSLVGAIVAVGEGKLSLEELKTCLGTGARVSAVQTAPGQGLFLEKVFY
jgi:tRNA pseudouridine38-40 synthase